MKQITTSDNCADAMSNPLERNLFYRHNDILGKIISTYAALYILPDK